MSDIAATLMSALGLGPKKKPVKPVLSEEEAAAPWLVPQGGGAVQQGGSAEVPTLPGAEAPPSRLDDVDALLAEIKKQKQRAAILGGSPAPQ